MFKVRETIDLYNIYFYAKFTEVYWKPPAQLLQVESTPLYPVYQGGNGNMKQRYELR